MLILLGVLLDGLVTLALGVVIAAEWNASPLFGLCLAALHGLFAGLCIIILLALRVWERDASAASPEAVTPGRARREPKVVPIFSRPRLDEAA